MSDLLPAPAGLQVEGAVLDARTQPLHPTARRPPRAWPDRQAPDHGASVLLSDQRLSPPDRDLERRRVVDVLPVQRRPSPHGFAPTRVSRSSPATAPPPTPRRPARRYRTPCRSPVTRPRATCRWP